MVFLLCVSARLGLVGLSVNQRKVETLLTKSDGSQLLLIIFLILVLLFLLSVGRLVLDSAGAISPSLLPSLIHPFSQGGGVSGGRRQRLLPWQQGPPPGTRHCSNMATLEQHRKHHYI